MTNLEGFRWLRDEEPRLRRRVETAVALLWLKEREMGERRDKVVAMGKRKSEVGVEFGPCSSCLIFQ